MAVQRFDQWHQSAAIHYANWVILDSLTTVRGRDTIRAVRRVTVQAQAADTFISASTELLRDTAAKVTQKTEEPPLTAESKKRGVAGLRSRVRMALCVFFFIFFAISLLCVKKNVFLRR